MPDRATWIIFGITGLIILLLTVAIECNSSSACTSQAIAATLRGLLSR